MCRAIWVLAIAVAITSFAAEETENKALQDAESAIVSSLKNDEILLGGQLIVTEHGREEILTCKGKYQVNSTNVMLVSSREITLVIHGTVSKTNNDIVVFSGSAKVILRQGKRLDNLELGHVGLRKKEERTVDGMDEYIEGTVDGKTKMSNFQQRLKLSANWR